MYVPATTPLVAPTMPNGETPITAGQIARSQAYLLRVNTAADNAKAAVLGSCQVPVSLTDTGTPPRRMRCWRGFRPIPAWRWALARAR